MELIGREDELRTLESIYSRPKMQSVVVYGRRRVGKTSLLKEFVKDKKGLFIYSTSKSFVESFNLMKKSTSLFLNEDVTGLEYFSDVMEKIEERCRKEKCVVVFDEFPYLISNGQFVPSVLQKFIDDNQETDLMLIVCGSSISVLLDETRNASKPLYQRFRYSMEIKPLSYTACRRFHDNMSDLDCLKVYMTVGGVPLYHILMDAPTYGECLKQCFLNEAGTLINEAQQIITSEVHPSESYGELVYMIAEGTTKQSKLSSKLGLDRATLNRRIKKLETLNIIGVRKPMLNAPAQPNYRIIDNLVAFWYEVLEKNIDLVNNTSISAEERIMRLDSDLSTFFGFRFEDICEQYVSSTYRITKIGKWWGRVKDDSGDHVPADIDIVAIALDLQGNDALIAAECKFRRKMMTFKGYNDLMDRWKYTGASIAPRVMLFSVSGFDEDLEEFAESRNIELVGMEKLMGRMEPGPMDGLLRTDA